MGVSGFSGDGDPAASAQLNAPQGLAIDALGNLYIADTLNHRVRMISGGTISTFAGNGLPDLGATGGRATAAQLYNPLGLAIDSSGNLYIADSTNNRIRMVGASGNIVTVAGTGVAGYSGDGAAATSARLYDPDAVATDGAGDIYIADHFNYRVRIITPDGNIATAAGNGTCCSGGDGGAATSARLCEPSGVALDGASNLYISDYCNQRIRMVSGGKINTIAGSGSYGYAGDGGLCARSGLPVYARYRRGCRGECAGDGPGERRGEVVDAAGDAGELDRQGGGGGRTEIKRDRRARDEMKKALGETEGFIFNRATSYSPTYLRMQYHRG